MEPYYSKVNTIHTKTKAFWHTHVKCQQDNAAIDSYTTITHTSPREAIWWHARGKTFQYVQWCHLPPFLLVQLQWYWLKHPLKPSHLILVLHYGSRPYSEILPKILRTPRVLCNWQLYFPHYSLGIYIHQKQTSCQLTHGSSSSHIQFTYKEARLDIYSCINYTLPFTTFEMALGAVNNSVNTTFYIYHCF